MQSCFTLADNISTTIIKIYLISIKFLELRFGWAFRLFMLTSICEAYHHWAVEHKGQQAITAAIEVSFYVKLLSAFTGEVLVILHHTYLFLNGATACGNNLNTMLVYPIGSSEITNWII